MPPSRNKLPELGEGDEYEMRVTDTPLYNVHEPKEQAIVSWRVQCFEREGFTPTAATALALRRDIDREQVERMRKRGATCAQIAGILL